jgi:predicted dehydrogenase
MIRLGVIGTGGMANAQANEFRKIKGVKLTACCDIVADRAKAFAEKFGIPAAYTCYTEMLAKEKLDGVTNVTIDAVHAEVALAVIRKGIAILSEKPLATTLADARKMAAAAKRAGVVNMVNFSYRNSCGLQQAAREMRAGKIGRVLHVESSYLQSWLVGAHWGNWRSSPGMTWRLSTRHGSAGVLGDLGCHIYDMTCLLCGDIASIDCRLKTFDKGVPGNRLGEYVLDANDSFVSTVVFRNGALGTVHSSRWATGHMNSLRVRVFGDKGAIEVDLDRAWDEYRICFGTQSINSATWESVKCRPTPSNYERFIRAIRTRKSDENNFANGAKIQAYLHYSFVSNDKGGPVAVRF